MTPYERQRPDLPYEARGGNRLPAGPQSHSTFRKPADFTDRELELALLPLPENPSPSLLALYAAVRHQMLLDGCP